MKFARSQLIPIVLLCVFQDLASFSAQAQTVVVRARVTRPVDMHELVTLRGNVHPLARPEFDQGIAPDDLPMERILLVLQRGSDQEAALRQLLDAQQVKSSPQFHQWLTPQQFGLQFGPADSDVQAVTDWLTSQGFQVTQISAGRTMIEFSGTAGLVRQTLGTEIHKFRVNGEDRWANASDPQIPAALAPVVAGFASLNNFPRKPMHESLGTFRRNKATGEVQPLTTIPAGCRAGNIGPCYYFAVGPADFATIYNVAPLWSAGTDGTGQTIAVVGETDINPQDVADFRSMFGLPANPPNITLNGPDPGILSMADEPEADLDVQWSGAVAKGATIDFVVSESTETTAGVDLSALYIVDNNLAPVMSESYGSCEASLGTGGNRFYSTLWEQAAAQGITVLMASGDSGSAGCDSANAGETFAQFGLGVSGFASTPFNVAVGGTDFNDATSLFTYWNTSNTVPSQSSAKSYIPESTWNDTCAANGITGCGVPLSDGIDLVAGSGGPSSCTSSSGTVPNVSCSGRYAKPSWQSGTGVPSDGARDIPDLSLFAGNGLDYSFYVTCQMDANARQGGSSASCDLNSPYLDFQGGSGTSASVQVFAGIMALVNQRYGRQGNANYVLYPMAAQSGASCNSSTAPVTSSSCIFYDITVGNNSVICKGGTPSCSNSAAGQYGAMLSGGAPAYQTTTGYDLATGLGSVNVANLVNNWKSTFTTSTTTLSLSTTPVTNPISLTHGQPINFTVNVATGSGNLTPTGDVSLIAQTGGSSSNVTGIGPFPLNGGSATGSTIMLPGGSYNVTAHYAGNGTLAASDSPPPGIPVTVTKESSQTEIRLVTFNPTTGSPSYGATSTAYGSPYVLRMDVTNSSGQMCAPVTASGEQLSSAYSCPTGSLTLSPAPTDENPPAGTVAGSYKLNSQGYAEDQPIQQLPGLYSFIAAYAGDNSYTGSTSATVPITITKAPTTTTLTGLPSTVLAGTTVSFTVTVSTHSSGVNPTGYIQVQDGNVTISTGGDYGTAAGANYASLSATLVAGLPAGNASITATYPGDNNYTASSSAAAPVTVTDFSVSASPATIDIPAPGQSGHTIITITPLYGFTGTVTVGCSFTGAAPGMSCTSTPVSLTGSSAVTTTLTITTTPQAAAALPKALRRGPPSLRVPAAGPQLLAALLALTALIVFATKSRRVAVWVFASALLAVGFWVACGGGSGGGGGGGGPAPAPSVSLSPSTLTFSSQTVGSTSAMQSVMLSNVGNAALNIASVGIGGTNPGDFAQTNNCGSSVTAGANCSIGLTFTPAGAGARSASLSISDSAGGSPQVVSLSGTGTQSTSVHLSTASLAFSQENLNQSSAPQNVTLSNSGNGSLSIASISIIGTNTFDFVQSNNCGGSVAAGANCAINVTFRPVDLGSLSASLAIADNASGSPQMVSLTGTGVPVATTPGTYPAVVVGTIGTVNHTIPISITVH